MSNLGDPPQRPEHDPSTGPLPAAGPLPQAGPLPPAASFPPAESLQFGNPSVGPGSDQAADQIAGSAVPSQPKRRRRAVIIGGSALAAVLVGGGVVWAASLFAAGGAQPETVVPATAIAYADVDLDPSAGQKVAAYRFLNNFPSVKKGSAEGDLLDQVLGTIFDDTSDVDYATDLKPWIGKRMGVAAIPKPAGSNGLVDPLVVLQVTNEDQARVSLRRLLDKEANRSQSSSSYEMDGEHSRVQDSSAQGLVVRDGFALVSTDQATTERLSAEAAAANLSDAPAYSADMDTLGDLGVATGWADLDAVATKAKSGADLDTVLPGGVLPGGRVAATVRFGDGNVELVARTVGAPASAAATAGRGHPGGPLLRLLPADTTAAIAIGDADIYAKSISGVLDALGGYTLGADAEETLGLKLPEDLHALLGTAFAVSVGDVVGPAPEVALRVQTAEPNASQAVAARLIAAARLKAAGLVEIPLIAPQPTADGIVYASSPEFAAKVAAAGTLGEQPGFTAAVPDAATATTAAYVSFERVRTQVTDADVLRNLQALRSVGLTSRTVGGDTEFRVTLVAQ